jgi:hypothetical protein
MCILSTFDSDRLQIDHEKSKKWIYRSCNTKEGYNFDVNMDVDIYLKKIIALFWIALAVCKLISVVDNIFQTPQSAILFTIRPGLSNIFTNLMFPLSYLNFLGILVRYVQILGNRSIWPLSLYLDNFALYVH